MVLHTGLLTPLTFKVAWAVGKSKHVRLARKGRGRPWAAMVQGELGGAL